MTLTYECKVCNRHIETCNEDEWILEICLTCQEDDSLICGCGEPVYADGMCVDCYADLRADYEMGIDPYGPDTLAEAYM